MQHRKPRYKIPEAADLLGTPRSTIYVRIKSGDIKIQKDGRRTFITAAEIDRYVAKTTAAVAP
jgi:excisionase family DNA binding protein